MEGESKSNSGGYWVVAKKKFSLEARQAPGQNKFDLFSAWGIVFFVGGMGVLNMRKIICKTFFQLCCSIIAASSTTGLRR